VRAYRLSLALFVVSVIALAAYASWAWPRRVDDRAHEAYAEQLSRIETLVHRLHEQVLRAHAGLAGSYDPIVQTLHELHEVHLAAAMVPAYVDGSARTAVDTALAASRDVLEQEGTRVERFKSENAVLLNSLRFFPVAAAQASERLAATPGSEASVAELRDLLRDVLRVAINPSAEATAEVQRHLTTLRAAALGDDVALLLRHAEVVAVRRDVVDTLLREILDQPAIERARSLSEAYAHGHALALARADEQRLTLFALALVVVVLAATTIIARLKHDADVLAKTSQQLAHAMEAQNRFVSMTSHEFRTPLSVIVSSTDLLAAYAEKWSPESRQKHLKRIEKAARGMTDLLDGLLLIGRSDAGHREFRPSDVMLDTIASESVEAQRTRAKDGTTVELKTSGWDQLVRMDTRLFRHAMDNLVSNGIKYGKPGGVVRVNLACDGKEVRLEVKDEGIGIPEDHLARLYDTFSRAKNVGQIQGTGLGLAIVKRAVDQHSGRIDVQSKVGVGTTFTVRIPVEAPLAHEESVAAEA
jgi:signal transduction histidine kinase